MHSPTFSHYRQVLRAVADLSPDFPPVRSRALGCRHAHRDGVSPVRLSGVSYPSVKAALRHWDERAGVAPVQKAALERIRELRQEASG
jgi:hypothetical protein